LTAFAISLNKKGDSRWTSLKNVKVVPLYPELKMTLWFNHGDLKPMNSSFEEEELGQVVLQSVAIYGHGKGRISNLRVLCRFLDKQGKKSDFGAFPRAALQLWLAFFLLSVPKKRTQPGKN
jgi:hypothetical protein